MKPKIVVSIAILIFLICGCYKFSDVKLPDIDVELSDIFVSQSEIDETLVNYALAENGAKIYVSEDNPNHPASTLNNGITSSEDWHLGEGWESHFDKRFAYGRYAAYGEDQWQAQLEIMRAEQEAIRQGRRPADAQISTEDFAEEDYKWRGLRGIYAYYAMGWAVVELPEPKRINRVIVYTVDSIKLPAEEYGVRDVAVQYWETRAKSWQNVNRYDKKIGQKDDSITGNVNQKIVFRFEPVETDKVRVVIRWTNDAEKYKLGFYRNIVRAKGTIRLTELEIYGTEKKQEEPQEDADIKELLEEDEDAEIKELEEDERDELDELLED